MLRNVIVGALLIMTCGAFAKPTNGWVEYCKVHIEDCTVNEKEPLSIKLTDSMWVILNKINVLVNRQIIPVTDMEKYGELDVWEIPTDDMGDCEDYSLMKRMLLQQAGFPHRAMRMTVVIEPQQTGHAVLTIMTDRGELILDNLTDKVVTRKEATYYVFNKIEDGHGQWIYFEETKKMTN